MFCSTVWFLVWHSLNVFVERRCTILNIKVGIWCIVHCQLRVNLHLQSFYSTSVERHILIVTSFLLLTVTHDLLNQLFSKLQYSSVLDPALLIPAPWLYLYRYFPFLKDTKWGLHSLITHVFTGEEVKDTFHSRRWSRYQEHFTESTLTSVLHHSVTHIIVFCVNYHLNFYLWRMVKLIQIL